MIGVCPYCGEFLEKRRPKRVKIGAGVLASSIPVAIAGLSIMYISIPVIIGGKMIMSRWNHKHYCPKCKKYFNEDIVEREQREKILEEAVNLYKK